MKLRFTSLVATVLQIASVTSADLRSIERNLVREPIYETKQPKYCLAVFGPEARERVWLVLDGKTLYVDRNQNLDLTDPGERVRADSTSKADSELKFDGGNVVFHKPDLPSQVRLEVLVTPPLTFVYCQTEGQPWQRAVVDPKGYLNFGSNLQTAPVLHFLGPLTVGLRFDYHFKRSGPADDLDVMVGTPGEGVGSFVRYTHNGIPSRVQPIIEATFPTGSGGVIKTKTILLNRC